MIFVHINKFVYLYGMNDFIGYSEAYIIRETGRRFRNYRQIARLRQVDVAFQSGVSVQTIRNFESGKSTNMTLDTFLKLLGAIGQRQNFDMVLPEFPNINDFYNKPVQRIKIKKP